MGGFRIVTTVALLAGSACGQVLRGHVEQRSFIGPITGQPVEFNVYLPEGYAAGTDRYPVIYHLHGLGGSQNSHVAAVPASFEAAELQGVIGRVIIVFADGYADAWWADSATSAKPAETDVVRQLVPYVDGNFRTIGTRGARAVQGFSMGGFGATKFYAKFPHVFAAAVEYDGAMLTWPNMALFFPQTATEVFGGSQAYFDRFSPWARTTANAQVLRAGPPIRIGVGALLPQNRSFRDHLNGLAIPVNYVEAPCGHDLPCLLNAQGLNSAAFLAARMDLSCRDACYANCDCSTTAPSLNVADFTCFLQRYAGADARANCDGSTDAPILNVADFSCYLQLFAAGCP